MTNYQKARVELTKTQLKKIKSTAKDNTGTIFKKSNKNFWDENLSHDLFLTTKQKAKVRNAIANNASTDTKLSQSQLAKIIQSGGFVSKTLGNLGKKVLLDFDVPLA